MPVCADIVNLYVHMYANMACVCVHARTLGVCTLDATANDFDIYIYIIVFLCFYIYLFNRSAHSAGPRSVIQFPTRIFKLITLPNL